MNPRYCVPLLAFVALAGGCSQESRDVSDPALSGLSPLLVAHRGASAYAPEHTLAAYELGIEQGADFIEPDLQITRDGVLIALHDLTLERTTNVRELFPDRFREEQVRGELARVWLANDFTLDEIKRLDAGSWFDPAFEDARIPTLSEVIDVARGRAGIFPETKAPEVYGDRGFSMERLLLAELERHGLGSAGGRSSDPGVAAIVQRRESPDIAQRARFQAPDHLPHSGCIVFKVAHPGRADRGGRVRDRDWPGQESATGGRGPGEPGSGARADGHPVDIPRE